MKKLLHILLLLIATASFGQAPVVSAPILVIANDNSLNIRTTILANGSANFSIIYSEDAFFTPSVTWYANNVTVLPTSTSTNVNYTIPCLNSGDNYYVKVSVTNSVGTTVSNYTTMTTTGSAFNNYPKLNTFAVGNLMTTSASINLTIDNDANAAVTGLLYYGLSETTMNSQLAVPSTNTDNASTSLNLASLTPNTTYYLRVNLSNGTNCTSSPIYQFTTPMVTTLLYHFPFNGNRDAAVGTGSFSSSGSGTFVSDGSGNASGALEVNSANNFSTQSQSATLSQLPQGNTARSVVMRVRFNDATATHYVVSWGGSSNRLSYGFEKTGVRGCSSVWGDNKCFPDQTFANTWATYVITYDGANNTARYYKDGIQVSNGQTHGTVNTTGTTIKLGTSLASSFGDANFWIDDLKIYSGVLSQDQITALSTTAAVPVITIVTSSSVGATSATINYSINAFNTATTPVVRYGTNDTNLNLSQTGSVVNGSTTTAQSINLTGLTAGTTYFYKVEASNAAGNAIPTSLLFFTTPAAAPVPVITNASAVSIGATSATINYSINANGAATTPIVRYGLTPSTLNLSQTGAVVNGSTTTAQSINITGLLPGTTYIFTVEAGSSAGNATPSSPLAFSTTVATTSIPDITAVTALTVGSVDANINYRINANGAATTPTIRYGLTSSNLNLSAVGPVVTGNTSTLQFIILTGLAANTTYFYRVEAANSAGSATPSSIMSFTTVAGNRPAISNVSVSGIGTNNATISFSINTFGANTTPFVNYFITPNGNDTVVQGTIIPAATPATTLHTIAISGLTPGTQYSYQVGAENSAGFGLNSLPALFTTTSLGLNENTQRLNFSMYPNPANSILNIDLDSQIKNVEIYSLLGQKVLFDNKKQVNISNLSNGVYMVKVEDENGAIATQKLLKE